MLLQGARHHWQRRAILWPTAAPGASRSSGCPCPATGA